MKKRELVPGRAFILIVNAEIDDLLISARDLTPAGFLNQAIDEVTEIVPGDNVLEEGQTTTKRFWLTLDRLTKIEQLAADTNLTANDVAIAAIRQYARNHPS